MQRLRVMAEYECHPIWREEADGVSNIAPDDLGLPEDLASRLTQWALRFEETFDRADPLQSGFPNASSQDQFYDTGLALAKELGQALNEAEIYFFDGRSGQTHRV